MCGIYWRSARIVHFASILEDKTLFEVAGAKSIAIAISDSALDSIRVIRVIRG